MSLAQVPTEAHPWVSVMEARAVRTDPFTHHVPDSQDNGARPYMTTQAAARRVPSVPRRNHLSTSNPDAANSCRAVRGVMAMVRSAVFRV